MSILTVIAIVLVILKITNLIAWSWVWVLAPFWATLIFWICLMVVLGCCEAIKNY